jgi:hypothetical protein
VANLVAQPEKHRLLLHLVNYRRPGRPIEGATVRCRAPAGAVRIYSPDAEVRTVTVGPDGSFHLPEIRTYSIAVIDLAERSTP